MSKRHPKVELICFQCGKSFWRCPSNIRPQCKHNFCGNECVAAFNRDNIHQINPNSLKNLGRKGERHPMWKGDKVGYQALHTWIRKTLGKPNRCEHCQLTVENSRKIHWANKSQEYMREPTDWLRLCISCHRKYDSSNPVKPLKKSYVPN